MIWKSIQAISHDDQLMKVVFDHVRNLGIAGLILGAATWTFIRATVTIPYFYVPVGVILTACSIWLVIVNMLHGDRKLREYGVTGSLRQVFFVVYALLVAAVVTSIGTSPFID